MILFNGKNVHTMGQTSSQIPQIQRQEYYVRQCYNKHKKQLSCNGKYNEQQIKGKLRQVYWNGKSATNNNEYVSKKDCKSYKKMKRRY